MGFLSIFGKLIIAFSVIGFLIGIDAALNLGSVDIGGASILALIGGFYLGYLGVKVDKLLERFQT
jgi:hypothetical protein